MLMHTPPLAHQFAGSRAAPPLDHQGGMLSEALHALITAIFARIFDRLEELIRRWQAGEGSAISPRSRGRDTTMRTAHLPQGNRILTGQEVSMC